MIELTKKEVERLARILGPRSNSAQALFIAYQRESGGQRVRFFKEGNAIIVDPVDDEGGGDAA
jgi:hypothetical protein